jgi:hypothetical protein
MKRLEEPENAGVAGWLRQPATLTTPLKSVSPNIIHPPPTEENITGKRME